MRQSDNPFEAAKFGIFAGIGLLSFIPALLIFIIPPVLFICIYYRAREERNPCFIDDEQFYFAKKHYMLFHETGRQYYPEVGYGDHRKKCPMTVGHNNYILGEMCTTKHWGYQINALRKILVFIRDEVKVFLPSYIYTDYIYKIGLGEGKDWFSRYWYHKDGGVEADKIIAHIKKYIEENPEGCPIEEEMNQPEVISRYGKQIIRESEFTYHWYANQTLMVIDEFISNGGEEQAPLVDHCDCKKCNRLRLKNKIQDKWNRFNAMF